MDRARPSRRRPDHPSGPGRAPRSTAPELLFCAICQVSVTAGELARGHARRTPRGRVFCPICTRATPEQRAARRAALEQEFADDAPIAIAGASASAGSSSRPDTGPPAAKPHRGPTLEDRVAELERAAFRMRNRLDSIDEKLDAILRRLAD